MALWGKEDGVSIAGTVEIAAGTGNLVGTGTTFTTELEIGYTIQAGADTFVVNSIETDTGATVSPVSVAGVAALTAITVSDAPKYLTAGQATGEVTLVTTAEAQDANNRVIGVQSPGWTSYTEYTDQNGNTRRKVETLVAMKS
jgi:hypothetical protein